jgi:phospholipid/cholesterol/gamma-HCH transport system substrate-binding protein
MSAAGKTIGHSDAAEVITGIITLVVAAAVLVLIYLHNGSNGVSGYEITAKIDKADGLGVGTDVRLAGFKIGSITSFSLDPNNFLVTVHMNIHNDVKIPTDSSLAVSQSSILGSQYIVIQPGGDSTNIQPGGAITNASGSIDLLGLINRIMAPPAQSAPKPQPQQSAPPSP